MWTLRQNITSAQEYQLWKKVINLTHILFLKLMMTEHILCVFDIHSHTAAGNTEDWLRCSMCDWVVSRCWECCKNTFPTWRSWVWVATSALTRSLQPPTGDNWLLTYLPVFNVTSNLKIKTKIIFIISDTTFLYIGHNKDERKILLCTS